MNIILLNETKIIKIYLQKRTNKLIFLLIKNKGSNIFN